MVLQVQENRLGIPGPTAPVGGRVQVAVQVGDAAVAVEQRDAAPGGAPGVMIHVVHAHGEQGVVEQVSFDHPIEDLFVVFVVIQKRVALFVGADEAAPNPAIVGQ